ncbi:MAG: ASKHA domain-containing protein, partial [Deltaproteobacteria bacterium]|nr:ASKHA domain-containing protein [Deltaproteobacteria bacterium]
TIQVQPGTALLDAARQAGVDVDAPCGGKGTCGNCALRIISGRTTDESLGVLTLAEIDEGFVLACRTAIGDDDVTVEALDQTARSRGQFSDDEGLDRIDPALLPAPEDRRPLTEKICLLVAPPQKADGFSDLNRLARTLSLFFSPSRQEAGAEYDEGGEKVLILYALPAVRQLADALREVEGKVTVTVAEDSPPGRTCSPGKADAAEQKKAGEPGSSRIIRVTAVEAGDASDRHYGIAIDVGTTTVVVQLVDLSGMKILGACTDYNGQLACGLDIISRIDYARRPDRREELRNRVLKTINHLIHQSAGHHRIGPHEISCAVISGNTTMTHLLLGLNPEYIRLDPFTPTVLAAPFLTAADVGIDIHPPATVMISPAVGSYVGGDITAGILCTDLSLSAEDVCLFMDIGTNGEVVLGNGEFLIAAACSAGPAFEGGGIKCGMRAADGAIEKVEIDPATGLADCRVIGQRKPRGVCGSGMISLLARLLQTGWIDPAGKLNRSRPSDAIHINGRKAAYTLVAAEQSATGRAIAVDEQDIENVIRAKASIYAACSLLLTQVGMTFRDLRKVYIAGGFGRFLNLDEAIAIGLLPNLPRDRVHFIGNASLKGSTMALISWKHRKRQHEQARRMTYLELSTTPAYMDQYTAALFLPHTDPAPFR